MQKRSPKAAAAAPSIVVSNNILTQRADLPASYVEAVRALATAVDSNARALTAIAAALTTKAQFDPIISIGADRSRGQG